MKTNKGGIKKYCDIFFITIEDLSKITGISFSQLYLIDKNPYYSVRLTTAEQIYKKTKKKFKVGLHPQNYLDFKFLHLK